MDTYTDIVPIVDPITELPRYFPTPLKPEAEFEFPKVLVEWIKDRDKHCMFPILDEQGLFVGYDNTDNERLDAHHITPIYYYKMFNPDGFRQEEHQTPLNGIALSHDRHRWLHTQWRQDLIAEYEQLPFIGKRVMGVDAYIALQTAQGRSAWWNKYDRQLYAIATIRTYEKLINNPDRITDRFDGLIRYYYEKLWERMTPFCESYYAKG